MASTYQYWRLLVYNNDGTSPATSIAEWKFYDGSGTQIATTGGTASSSSNASGFTAAAAFDGNPSTIWASNDEPSPSSPDWLQYQFPSAVTVASFSISDRNDGSFVQSPSAFSLQGSSDGSTWVTVGNYCAVDWVSAAQVQTFVVGSFGLGTAFRLLITADSAGQSCALSEWGLYTGTGVLSTPVGGAAASSSGGYCYASSVNSNAPASSAFDGSVSTYWASNAVPSSGSPQYIVYRSSQASLVLSHIVIRARNDSNFSQAPTAFSLQSSPDGVTWTTLVTIAATWTSAGQVQGFDATSGALVQPYTFISSNNAEPIANSGRGANHQAVKWPAWNSGGIRSNPDMSGGMNG